MSDIERPLTIPEALQGAARRFANRTAYVEGGAGTRHSITWAELDRLAHETAAGLIALGLQRGDRVAVCAQNSIDWIAAYLATVLAGGVGVLVYYDLKAPEIEEQVRRPLCRMLIASQEVIGKLPAGIEGVSTMIAIGAAGGSQGGARKGGPLPFASVGVKATAQSRRLLEARAPAPDDLAAVIYTSGTTGGAKGVMLSHRNFLSNGHGVIEALDVGADDCVLLVLPLHHSMPFLATIILPPLVGARFVIENDLRRIRDRMQEYKPTIFFGVPALFEIVYRNVLARAEAEGRLETLQAWLKRGRLVKRLTGINIGPLLFRQVHKALGGRLRFLYSGGAALNPQTARDFFALGLPLLQGWGMTEASPAVAFQRFSPRRFRFTRYYEEHAGSVGPPVPGVEVRLIDVPEKDIRVGVSGEGEVIVRGDNVFQGYWEAPEATREAKLDGWLRTGDLGRIDGEGNIYLTGRSKYVIVLESGEKVHPDELEDKLRENPLLADVCIVGRKAGDKTLVTAVVYPSIEAAREHNAADDEASLRKLVEAEVDRLSKQLAAYKRVSRVELTDEPLPKTVLQKVARGRIAESHSFNHAIWLASAPESRS
jgi:long-chain acyl-CoA synthetase